mgnify:CR=1 FL=1
MIAPVNRPIAKSPTSVSSKCRYTKVEVLSALSSGTQGVLQNAIAAAGCSTATYNNCNVTLVLIIACYTTSTSTPTKSPTSRRRLSTSGYTYSGLYVSFRLSTYAESLGYNGHTVDDLSTTIEANLNASVSTGALGALIQTQAPGIFWAMRVALCLLCAAGRLGAFQIGLRTLLSAETRLQAITKTWLYLAVLRKITHRLRHCEM